MIQFMYTRDMYAYISHNDSIGRLNSSGEVRHTRNIQNLQKTLSSDYALSGTNIQNLQKTLSVLNQKVEKGLREQTYEQKMIIVVS